MAIINRSIKEHSGSEIWFCDRVRIGFTQVGGEGQGLMTEDGGDDDTTGGLDET